MALFRRSQQNQKSVLPEEVSQYYQSQRRERTGVALVLGVVALIVTLLIGSALFFGGRYVYRQFANDDNKPASTEQTATPAPASNQDGKTPAQSGTDNTEENSSNSDTENTEGSTTPSQEQASGSAGTNGSNNSATPSLGDESLPHTGDPGM